MGQGRPSTRGNNAYQPRTEIGENDIPVTDSTSDRVEMTHTLPDFEVKGNRTVRSAMRGKLPISKTSGSYGKTYGIKKEQSNIITNNPFVPNKKFKMPKLKFSGTGKRTAMRGKIR